MDKCGYIGYLKFLQQIAAVALYRKWANKNFLTDLCRVQPLRQPMEHFFLPARNHRQISRFHARYNLPYVFAKPYSARYDLMDSIHYFIPVGILKQISRRTGLQHALDDAMFINITDSNNLAGCI